MNNSKDQLDPLGHYPQSSNPLKNQIMKQFDQPKAKPDFSALQSLIKLPPLVKLKPETNPFQKPANELNEGLLISNSLKKNVIEQRELLLHEFEMFQTPQDFQFYFPESKFPTPPPGAENSISYYQQPLVEHQNTYRNQISPEQIAEIKEKGQFAVKSSREWVKIPYIWKMNETLFKGIRNIQRDWNMRLCAVVSAYQTSWQMLTEGMPQSLANIGKFPWRIITLLFGKKQMRVSHAVNYNQQIAKDFWSEVMTKHYVVSKEWSSDLWTFLDTQFKASVYEDVPFGGNVQQYKILKKQKAQQLAAYDTIKKASNQKIDNLLLISSKFSEQWDKVSKKIFNQISNSVQQKFSQQKSFGPNQSEESERKATEETEILQKFQEEEFTYYLNFVKKQFTTNKIPINVIEAILTLLILMHVAKKKQNKWNENIENLKEKLQKEIKNENPIRSMNYWWFEKKRNSMFKPIELQQKEEFYKEFLDLELRSKLNTRQIQVFNLWVDYVRTYETRFESKQEQKQNLYEPLKTFRMTYMILPPYQVIRRDPQPDSQQRPYFQMPKFREISVTTASCGWKFKLYCMKLKAWAINAFVTLVYFCWSATFGLRCLCGVDDFAYDQYVENYLGTTVDETRKTVLGHFISVLEGIRSSRDAFQAQPDTGIFGKICSRICNLLECYLFRFFIVGVLVILTLYPLAIILVSTICFFFIITIWAWMPAVILLSYLFNIFIYNFDNVNDWDCWHKVFPLFVLIFRLIFAIFKVIFYISAFFVFMPLACFFIIIFACVCRCMRSMSDTIVLCFLRCCGHVPSTDSMFAEKISGPGLASNFFLSINEEDVYYLIQAQLQQIHLKQIETLVKAKLNAPIDKFKNTMRFIVEPLLLFKKTAYGSSSDSYLFGDIYNHPISKSIQAVSILFNEKCQYFRRRYPQKPTDVRFTQEELSQYFQNTQSIVEAYVNSHKLNKWIFVVYGVPQNDFAELTRKIWIDLFQCGQQIFEPLQSIEERFKFEDQYSSFIGLSYSSLRLEVGKVVNAIKGEADLRSKKVAVFSPLNSSLLSRKYPIAKVSELLGINKSNSERSVFFDKSSPLIIFFPHLSIKELIKYEEATYIKLRAENRRNMEKW